MHVCVSLWCVHVWEREDDVCELCRVLCLGERGWCACEDVCRDMCMVMCIYACVCVCELCSVWEKEGGVHVCVCVQVCAYACVFRYAGLCTCI